MCRSCHIYDMEGKEGNFGLGLSSSQSGKPSTFEIWGNGIAALGGGAGKLAENDKNTRRALGADDDHGARPDPHFGLGFAFGWSLDLQ